jgi:hypothetical protein
MAGWLPLFKTFVCLYRQTGASWPSPFQYIWTKTSSVFTSGGEASPLVEPRTPCIRCRGVSENVSVYTDKVPANQYIPALLPPRYEWRVVDSQSSGCCLPYSSLSPNVLCLRLRQREGHSPRLHFPALFVQTDRTFLAVSAGKQPET